MAKTNKNEINGQETMYEGLIPINTEGLDQANPLNRVPKKQRDMSCPKITTMAKEELRIVVDTMYQAQDNRIVAQARLRAMVQGYDTGEAQDVIDGVIKGISADNNDDLSEEAQDVVKVDKKKLKEIENTKYPLMAYVVNNRLKEEQELAKAVDAYTDTLSVGQWAKANKGIGPLIAGALIAYLDISKCSKAGQFWSYAGYNDNNDPWLSAKQIADIQGMVSSKVTDEELIAVSKYSGRAVEKLVRGCEILNNEGTLVRSKDALIKYLKKPPFNRKLKMTCWKLGESFVKVSNKPDSLYGRMFKERKAYEKQKNLDLDYIQESLKTNGYIQKVNANLSRAEELALLKKFQEDVESKRFIPKFGKATKSYQTYFDGKLSDAHINARAKRYAVKMFLSHLFEAMYLDYYGKPAPNPYVLDFMNHSEYIGPEVPYEEYITPTPKKD